MLPHVYLKKKNSYKLVIFSDGYASPKFIPHKIFVIEIYVNEKKANYGSSTHAVHRPDSIFYIFPVSFSQVV